MPGLALPETLPRHSALVRVTHWIHTAGFLALLVSGIAILITHPRLYWGETGALGTPSLVDLPLPLILGPSGWGRYLHFLAAWVCVLNGLLYVAFGLRNGHFRKDLVRRSGPASYNPIQRLVYLGVVFVLFPLVIATGLAMSPAVTSVVPALVTVFGGHQSARTLHFVVAGLLAVFLLVHILMVYLAGFARRTRAMITGRMEQV